MSILKVRSIRHDEATTDAITIDSAGNVTAPTSLTVDGTNVGSSVSSLNTNMTSVQNVVHSDRIRLQTHTTEPSNPSAGDMYYHTGLGLKMYDGSGWTIVGVDLSPFSNIVTTSMPHSCVNTTEAGSGAITTYGCAAISQPSYSSGEFGMHDGHEGAPADWPAYGAVYIGSAKPVNRMDLTVHNNSMGHFELQGSNDASTSGTFYNTGTWTSLPFVTSNNSQGNQNGGGQSSGYSDGHVLTFEYNNNTPYTHYRIWIKDGSKPAEAVGTRYVGWADYYWRLYRV
jgi:hypothetical protein